MLNLHVKDHVKEIQLRVSCCACKPQSFLESLAIVMLQCDFHIYMVSYFPNDCFKCKSLKPVSEQGFGYLLFIGLVNS